MNSIHPVTKTLIKTEIRRPDKKRERQSYICRNVETSPRTSTPFPATPTNTTCTQPLSRFPPRPRHEHPTDACNSENCYHYTPLSTNEGPLPRWLDYAAVLIT
ncbi:hypothetical protein GWI33_015444 [Rhynchophorus ferrugineus]|uniref:Uncharacterized protein n=1 Tax=Rhynchophorus ferrugineus TaxID=354439 RepID=A0A834I377_RHYFE|nr:hypothetical protein GWI33_015444 [Rhynchophorus ferrugineus]